MAAHIGRVRRVDLDFYEIDAGWHHGLPVTSIQKEVLPSELEDVRVRPARADPLEAVDRGIATAAIRPRAVAVVDVVGIRVEHAEASLRCFPHVAILANEPVRRVVLEVKVPVA